MTVLIIVFFGFFRWLYNIIFPAVYTSIERRNRVDSNITGYLLMDKKIMPTLKAIIKQFLARIATLLFGIMIRPAINMLVISQKADPEKGVIVIFLPSRPIWQKATTLPVLSGCS